MVRRLRLVIAATACLLALGPADAAGAVGPPPPMVAIVRSGATSGYWLVRADGAVYPFGGADPFLGPASVIRGLRGPIVAAAATRDRRGLWLVGSDGGVFTFGDAPFYGSLGGTRLNAPVVAIAVTPSGNGYWLLARDGGVFTFGDAPFFGSATAAEPAQSWVGITPLFDDPGHPGYSLVSAGGSFVACGRAFGCSSPTRPIVGLAAPVTGLVAQRAHGFTAAAADGGVFAYSGARFFGSMAGQRLTGPVVGLEPTADGGGYWLVGSDGGVFTFGDARFAGSAAG
jgi:hypothetical protein